MNKKFGIILLILVVMSLLLNLINFISTNNLISEKNTIQSEYNDLLSKVQQLETETQEIKDENNILAKSFTYLQQRYKSNNNLIEEQIKLINLMKDDVFLNENEIIPIYSADVDDYNKEIIFYTSVSKELSLDQKLSKIGTKLSQYCFEALPIELQEIKDIEDKKIAIINLKESPLNQEADDYKEMIGNTWSTYYFQGSTGGVLTSTKLTETFLQQDYKGEWIDGVQFLYEGSKIDFEHVLNLNNIIYR